MTNNNNINSRGGRHREHTTTATENHRTQLTATSCLEREGHGADGDRTVRNGLPRSARRGRGSGALASFLRCIEGSTINIGSRKSCCPLCRSSTTRKKQAMPSTRQEQQALAGGAPGTSRSSERKSNTRRSARVGAARARGAREGAARAGATPTGGPVVYEEAAPA